MAKVRLTDIANRVGVSTATVSRAIRNELSDSNPVLQDVLVAARRMGYQMPRRQPRPLGKVALVALGIQFDPQRGNGAPINNSGFYGRFVYGVQAGVRENEGSLSLTHAEHDDDLHEVIQRAVKETDADGVILLGGFSGSAAMPRSTSVPVVLLNAVADGQSSADSVAPADLSGTEMVVRHLHAQGHRRIAFWTHTGNVGHHEQRLAGYRSAIAHLGLEKTCIFMDHLSDQPYAARMAAEFTRFVAETPRPTAIVCSSDAHALALIRLAYEHGIAVPRELSIVGFDNTEASAHSIPALTTVDAGLEDMGREAVHLLAQRAKRPADPIRQVILRAKLVERDTAAAVF